MEFKKIMIVYPGYHEILHGFIVDNSKLPGEDMSYVIFVQEKPIWEKTEKLRQALTNIKNAWFTDGESCEHQIEYLKLIAENALTHDPQI